MLRPLSIALALAATLAAGAACADDKPKAGVPDLDKMQTYYLVLLYRAENPPQLSPEKSAEIQKAHLANIQRLADEGRMALAGPFVEEGDLRGLFLLQAANKDEAKQLCDSDPAIQAGRLRADIHTWFGPKGIKTVFSEEKAKAEAAGK